MATLRVDSPALAEAYAAMLVARGVKLPLRLYDEAPGVVVDAAGTDVLVVDSNSERPDDDVTAIAALIVAAVNVCAGFRAEAPHG